jgi:hypothetical protein
MADPVSVARSARENLAQGLAALQHQSVPPGAQDVAEPVALAMRALHGIEASHGAALGDNAPQALDAVRRALAMLQTQPEGNPAIDRAIEAIADSLGLIHSLNQQAQAAMSLVPETQPSAPGYEIPDRPPDQAWEQPEPEARWEQPAQQSWAEPPRQQWQQPAQQHWEQPAQPHWEQPAQSWQEPQPRPWQAPPTSGAERKPPVRVEAELGAHSSTNFYKGLSGNDVIDSGGIFIATYQIPNIGQDLIIKVNLPGGYEFEAMGIVKWTRDAPDSGADAPPGYGAQFTQISPEGRQLVYRYVRNREPLFHDDL